MPSETPQTTSSETSTTSPPEQETETAPQESEEPSPLTREEAISNLQAAAANMAEHCTAAVNVGVPIHEVMAYASQALTGAGS